MCLTDLNIRNEKISDFGRLLVDYEFQINYKLIRKNNTLNTDKKIINRE